MPREIRLILECPRHSRRLSGVSFGGARRCTYAELARGAAAGGKCELDLSPSLDVFVVDAESRISYLSSDAANKNALLVFIPRVHCDVGLVVRLMRVVRRLNRLTHLLGTRN